MRWLGLLAYSTVGAPVALLQVPRPVLRQRLLSGDDVPGHPHAGFDVIFSIGDLAVGEHELSLKVVGTDRHSFWVVPAGVFMVTASRPGTGTAS